MLSIEVSLAPPPNADILSPFSATAPNPRASNIDAFHAEPAQLDRAADELGRLGFRVLIGSRLSLSVEEEREPAAPALPAARSFLAPAPEAAWAPPDPLSGLV